MLHLSRGSWLDPAKAGRELENRDVGHIWKDVESDFTSVGLTEFLIYIIPLSGSCRGQNRPCPIEAAHKIRIQSKKKERKFGSVRTASKKKTQTKALDKPKVLGRKNIPEAKKMKTEVERRIWDPLLSCSRGRGGANP